MIKITLDMIEGSPNTKKYTDWFQYHFGNEWIVTEESALECARSINWDDFAHSFLNTEYSNTYKKLLNNSKEMKHFIEYVKRSKLFYEDRDLYIDAWNFNKLSEHSAKQFVKCFNELYNFS